MLLKHSIAGLLLGGASILVVQLRKRGHGFSIYPSAGRASRCIGGNDIVTTEAPTLQLPTAEDLFGSPAAEPTQDENYPEEQVSDETSSELPTLSEQESGPEVPGVPEAHGKPTRTRGQVAESAGRISQRLKRRRGRLADQVREYRGGILLEGQRTLETRSPLFQVEVETHFFDQNDVARNRRVNTQRFRRSVAPIDDFSNAGGSKSYALGSTLEIRSQAGASFEDELFAEMSKSFRSRQPTRAMMEAQGSIRSKPPPAMQAVLNVSLN